MIGIDAILDCGHAPSPAGLGTGYGVDAEGRRHCYDCCATRDKASMTETGKATLYLVPCEPLPDICGTDDRVKAHATNWPGTLKIPIRHTPRKGRHNIAGSRYDVWFTGPDGATWHGVQYGENTQILHCRRTKG